MNENKMEKERKRWNKGGGAENKRKGLGLVSEGRGGE